jgi:hypothetical protein
MPNRSFDGLIWAEERRYNLHFFGTGSDGPIKIYLRNPNKPIMALSDREF